jgi:hypothetical protein
MSKLRSIILYVCPSNACVPKNWHTSSPVNLLYLHMSTPFWGRIETKDAHTKPNAAQAGRQTKWVRALYSETIRPEENLQLT